MKAGAKWLVLCDTNGGTMPEDVYRIVSDVKAKLPDAALGIHAHNDTEQAVAVSLAAIRAGARQVQGTLNGLGERCGNANLCALLPNLMLKEPFASQFETGVTREKPGAAHPCLAAAGRNPQPRAQSLCRLMSAPRPSRTRAGLHVSAVVKDPQTYEHVPPEAVGNKRIMPVSAQSGRANVAAQSRRAGIDGGKPDLARLLQDVKRARVRRLQL